MTNNDIFRRLRYLFDYNDLKMVSIFKLAAYEVTEAEVAAWLKQENDVLFKEISDRELAVFLSGLIIEKRGKKDGPIPEPEDPLTNNMILRKLKIALNLKSDDILAAFAAVDKAIGKHELSAFFRDPEHRTYRNCMDQYLRNFLNGLQEQKKKKMSEN